MYKCRKRIAVLALAALMGLSCTGCGKSNESSSQPIVTQAETTAETTTVTTTAKAAKTSAKKTTTTTTTAETTTTTTPEQETTAPQTAAVHAAPIAKVSHNTAEDGSLDSFVKNYPYNSSVILYCMDGKTLYSNAPNRVYYGASMIKLPYVYYCCTQLENGVHSLSETVTYTADDYHGGSGVIIHRGVGEKYTIEQLIDYSLRYSDNVAHDMLVRLFGTEGFNKMMSDWGYSNVKLYSYNHFADLTPDFILTSMRKMQQMSTNSGKSWQTAWNALLGSEGLRIKNYFSKESVAGKYGLYSGVYHEVCYFGGNEPYILVVMTNINDYNVNDKYMTNIAAAARAEVNKYTAEKEAAKTTTTTTEQTSPTEETTTEPAPETTSPEESTPPETAPEAVETSETTNTTPYDEN